MSMPEIVKTTYTTDRVAVLVLASGELTDRLTPL